MTTKLPGRMMVTETVDTAQIADGAVTADKLATGAAAGLEANTFTGTQTITSTDAGAAQGPVLELYRNSASPAAADDIGAILFQGEDSGGGLENYARIRGVVVDPTAASEDGKLTVHTVVAGTLAERVAVGGGMWMAGATGGDPGAGKINATEVQVNGVALASRIIQVVNTQTGAVATGSTTIPFDDTIPQNTEGDEYMTLAITPTSATNKLKIDVTFNCAVSALAQVCVALFQDSTANAVAAMTPSRIEAAGVQTSCTFSHYMTAGTTSATTFKVRAGPTSGTLTFNGSAGSRLFGGVMASSITITEIKV